MRWVARLAALAVVLGGLVSGPGMIAVPVAADCGMGPPPQHAAGYRGIAFIGTVTATERGPRHTTALTVDVERPILGVDSPTLTIVSEDKGCSYFWGDQLTVGDRFLLAFRPVQGMPFELREGATYADSALAYRPTADGWRFARGLSLYPELFPERALRADTLAEILAYLRLDPPATDAAPSTSPDPRPSASSAPTGSPPPSVAPLVVANAQRPLTLDELVALLDVVDAPTTVVADVTVRRDVVVAGGPCPRRIARITGCRFGFLDGPSDTSIPVTATTRVAAGFRDGVAPSGPLVFQVDRDQLRLLGALTRPTDTYTVPVTAQSMASADGLPLNDVIAVDGWLGVLLSGVRCLAYPGVLGRMGDASPFVRCPGGWITAGDTTPDMASGTIRTEPEVFAIPVQAAAYEAFAPDPAEATDGATPPRHATYLLRHVGNPESSVGPPMGWLVVGRLDPVDETGMVLAPTASPVIGADPPLRDPVVATGRKVPLDHRRAPDARAEQDGVVLELWLPQGAIGPGDWLAAHLRITNTRASTITIDCPPAHTRALTHRLFDPGRRWWSRGAAFKQAILGETWVGSVPFGSERNGVECPGSVGLEFNVRPGERLEYDTFALPRALAGDQPLPAGMLPVRAELRYDLGQGRRREPSLAVQASVRLAGPDWPWATPVEMVDAALADPTFAEWIATRNRPTWWGEAGTESMHGDGRGQDPPGVAEWSDFGFTGPAPDGTLILSLDAGPPGPDGWTLGRVLLDPWTAQVLGVDIGAE